MIERPEASEYAPFYAGYIASLPDDIDILAFLGKQRDELQAFGRATAPEKETFRYAEGKWSLREVAGHLIDGERVFAYRVLRFSRGDQTPLPGFDENEFIAGSTYNDRALASLVDEFVLARGSNLALFESLPAEGWLRTGTANGYSVSVRALAFIMAGHVNHHLKIVRERYGISF